MVSKAHTKYIRISPRKAREVVDLIRGEKVDRALAILTNVNKKAKVSVEKTLRSAMSNAQANPAVKSEELVISKIVADKGPMFKRYRAAAMGRATMIRHRTTHLTVELSGSSVEKVKTSLPKRAKQVPGKVSKPARGKVQKRKVKK
ncbi:MAG: 50S ribosomal protein L22 [Candidatus Omnitrophica bacterium]|nr:50S ribosomal protein L22 [Candidatus Omnitrophota bacterium]